MGVSGDILRVSYYDLTRSDNGDAVMSPDNYKILARRGRINVVNRGGGLGNGAEVEWETLPVRFRERYVAKYGDPESELLRRSCMITYDEQARAFFAGYVLPDGSALKEDKQQEYLVNASVLNRLAGMVSDQRRERSQRGNRTPVSWEGIVEMSEQLRAAYGHTLPKSAARLRDKMREYSREGYGCLVSGKLCNANTTKLTGEVAEWLLEKRVSVNPKYTVGQIFALYNETAPSMGWKPIKSTQTLLEFFGRPDVRPLCHAVEQGAQSANNLFNRQNRTIMPGCRDALWYVDGTKVNLYFQYWDEKSRQTKAGTTSCIYVMDAFSEVFLGWYVCGSESFLTTYEALRNAIERTGFLPYELVSDNQSGFTSSAALRWRAKLGTVSHTTTPGNGKSKTIESAFGRFQAEVMRGYINYTGGNITAKSPKTRVNTELIVQNVLALPTYDEVVKANEDCIRTWNSMPHPRFKGKSRMEVYRSSVNPRAIALTDVVREKVFYISTEKASTFRAGGIEITVKGRKYVYEVFGGDGEPDYGWRRENTGRQFVVEYDPHDMSRVRLCVDDRKYGLQFNTWAEPYRMFHRAMQDQTDGERAEIRAALDANKREIVRRDLDARALQMKGGGGYESAGYDAPLPQGVTRKEYDRFADEIRRERSQLPSPAVSGTLPSSVAQIQKEQSNFSQVTAYDKM